VAGVIGSSRGRVGVEPSGNIQTCEYQTETHYLRVDASQLRKKLGACAPKRCLPGSTVKGA
jgi:hypothetical protein